MTVFTYLNDVQNLFLEFSDIPYFTLNITNTKKLTEQFHREKTTVKYIKGKYNYPNGYFCINLFVADMID
jgi:hypothetical protein